MNITTTFLAVQALLLLLLSVPAFTQPSGWFWQSPPPMWNQLNAVDFVDATTGTAVGAGGVILRTTDGGTTWLRQTSGTTSWLTGVSFTSANTGTAVGSGGTILRTTDGGTTWSSQTSGTTYSLLAVSFTDANTGTAVGWNGKILRTTNGGTTWTSQGSGTTMGLYGVSFSSATTGTAVGEGGTIRRTTNGGASWTSQSSGIFEYIVGVSFTDANTGTAVAGYGGTILRTTNGGSTWVSQTSGTSARLNGVSFISASTGTVVGERGTILRTTNGGALWVGQTSGATNTLYGVSITDASRGTVVGDGGTIRHTTDGGATWVYQASGTTNNLLGVSFPDAATGTAVGSNGTILRTTNSGAAWVSQASGTTYDLSGVSFVDANTGTAVGGYGTILHTTNGGTSWVSQTSGTTDDLFGISVVDANTGIAVGRGGKVLRTTNGGSTWVSLAGINRDMYGVSFSDPDTGMVVGKYDGRFRTTDGGATWENQGIQAWSNLAVSFTDGRTGTIVGEAGRILHTTDGGANWTYWQLGSYDDLYGVSFTDANTGTVVGDHGTILRTTNGGATWGSQTSGTTFPLKAVSFTDPYSGTAVGYGGAILRTNTGGEPAPLFSASPASFAFGAYAVGDTTEDNLYIENNGSVPLVITGVASTAPEFTIDTTSGIIAPGDSLTFGVMFTPADTGMRIAAFIFTHNGPSSPDTVSVSGTGVPTLIPGDYLVGTAVFKALAGRNTLATRSHVLFTDRDRRRLGLPHSMVGAYTTIGAALADLDTTGVIGHVRYLLTDSTYPAETFPLDLKVSATFKPSPTATVTLKPDLGVSPHIVGLSPIDDPLLRVRADYVSIDGSNTEGGATRDLAITNYNGVAVALSVWDLVNFPDDTISHVTVKNTILADTSGGSGTLTVGPSFAYAGGRYADITIDNNEIHGGKFGIWISGMESNPGRNVIVRDNILQGVHGIGIIAKYSDGVQISGNDLSNFVPVYFGYLEGIRSELGATNVIVERNVVHDLGSPTSGLPGGNGIAVLTLDSLSNVLVANNLIYGMTGAGASFSWTDNPVGIRVQAPGAGVRVYHNSISLSGSTLSEVSGLSMGIGVGSGGRPDIRNNIIVNNLGLAGGTGIGSCGVYFQDTTNLASTLDHNLYYVNPPGTGIRAAGMIETTPFTTLAAWQSATGGETHGVGGDPLFVSATDLHVSSPGSPAGNAGVFLSDVTEDFDNEVRSNVSPDIGADEFAPNPAALTAGDYTIGISLFNRLTGKHLVHDRASRKVVKEVPVSSPEPDHSSSFAPPTTLNPKMKEVEMTEEYGILTENGRPYTGSQFAVVTADRRRELGLDNTLVGAYATITAAFTDLDASGLLGHVRYLLTDSLYPSEAFPLDLKVSAPIKPNPSATITFKPAAGVSPHIVGLPMMYDPLLLIRADYVTIDGSNTEGGTSQDLTIRNQSGVALAISVWSHYQGSMVDDTVEHVTVKNCVLVADEPGYTGGGVTIGSPYAASGGWHGHVAVDNNLIHGGNYGLWISGRVFPPHRGRNVAITNNMFENMQKVGISARYVDTLLISGNEIRNFITSYTWPSLMGIHIQMGTRNAIVERNRIHDIGNLSPGSLGGKGIVVTQPDTTPHVLLRNNLLYNLGGSGADYATSSWIDNPMGIVVASGDGTVGVYHNSIRLEGTTLNQAGGLSMGIGVGSGGRPDIRNNIIVNNLGLAGGTGIGSCGVYFQDTTNLASTLDHNLYFVNPSGTGIKAAGMLGTNVSTTLAAWQSATGKETHGVAGNPLFVSGTDLHVSSSGSPAANAGTPLPAVTSDVDGETRSTVLPDIGADEFAPVPSGVAVGVQPGWNMLSNPITASNDSVTQLYPGSAFGYAFSFTSTAGYQQSYRMVNGKGYWAKLVSGGTQTLLGTARTGDSVTVSAGWNMVGSISYPVDTAAVTSVPPGIRTSQWYGYGPGYNPSAEIVPGKAYWVKASATGKFFFSMAPVPPSAKAAASERDMLAELNTLTITDAAGGSQTLYFGPDRKAALPVEFFEMPPPPPAGVLDARFETAAGGSMVQTHDVGGGLFPITLHAGEYPLTVAWQVREGSAVYTLHGETKGSARLEGQGMWYITNGNVNRMVLETSGEAELPEEFALFQNYPNPFNPSTTIKFALPVAGRVTVEIFNILGQQVKSLVNEDLLAGYHTAEWNGTGNAGQQLGSGIYFLRLTASAAVGTRFTDMRKLVLVK